ncbi:SDR family NAD(P)-dependent oxidoreductase [Alteribacillus sp. YIM 98480]|uniref:SDR family NAD(P)-dependent oxidoreductase n=1 Tax=Alteribacillus sp. YIM 98480 TaxID=2606599 RepID=UPI00131D60F3|nr:SDR family oxidoreductase [Alteribacillus sp. YIM 98480]
MLNHFDVENKNVLITGASSGIGFEISKAFLNAGASVINWDINHNESVEHLKKNYPSQYKYLLVNVTDESMIKEAMKAGPKHINILINNAGIILKSKINQLTPDDIDNIYDINVKGTMLVTKHILNKMKEINGGRIINLSSMTSRIGLETYSLYSSTKAAVSNLTKVWALELANEGITVNAICPGWTNTPMKAKLVENISRIHNLNVDEATEAILSYVPQNRFIETEEIAFTCLFLSSTLAKGISGQEIFIDNGLTNTFPPNFHVQRDKDG